MVTNRIGRGFKIPLNRIRPTLVMRAMPRKASLALTILTTLPVRAGIGSDPNIAVAAFHDGEVVRRTIDVSVCAVAELEQRLGSPLPVCAPFGVAGETHADFFEGGVDGEMLTGVDVGWVGLLEHFEGWC